MTISHAHLLESLSKGVASDGQPARVYQLKNSHGMVATFMDVGATWLSCQVPVRDEMREVLLGCDTMEKFNQHSAFMGVTVGRYANRIANGQFSIDGTPFQIEVSKTGHMLHGGKVGFDKYRWNVDAATEQRIQFSIVSADGDQGFPGEAKVIVTYELTELNEVKIGYTATTSKPTLMNLTNHAYFNLMGADSGEDCLGHVLSVNANQFLPTDELGIPVGELRDVAETGFDFLSPKVIGQDLLLDEEQKLCNGYDHSFLLSEECLEGECAATVTSPDSLLTMKMFTTKPAVQLYTGNFLQGTANRIDGQYDTYGGVALETQYLPDSPNHPEWPRQNCVLREGETYNHTTTYQFLNNM
ncbi:galactose-1-epimerase [Vibrio breoganii]|uniref:galactose-1-epimerase n=1 Tax=Vibrio breoganii TaxID=553239 RepID=UPI00030CCA73|nr:galactose-1-epimerase [Vibrio breoganii]OEF82755.1 galactose-1-epimerase [Vibrio breoganii 1C10]TKF86013.1 galactose-1-epimerase [Vibrio breoganii]